MFLGLVAGFGMDYIKALLLVDMTAFLVLMLNPLWLGCGRARRGRGGQSTAVRQRKGK